MAPHCSRLPWIVPKKLPADMCRARDTLETPELTPALDIEEPHQGGCLYSSRAARVFVSVRPQPSRGWKVDLRRRVDETYVDLVASFVSGFVAGGKHASSVCKYREQRQRTGLCGRRKHEAVRELQGMGLT